MSCFINIGWGSQWKNLSGRVPVQQLEQSGCIYLPPPPKKKKYIYKREGWRNFLMGTHAHMCINTHTHTRIQLHTSTVFCLWNWKCDVTWTMTGVFVKDVAVTSNQWTGASSQGDFPLLRVWLVTPRFSAGWRTVSCQSGIQGVSAEVSSDQEKKKKD